MASTMAVRAALCLAALGAVGVVGTAQSGRSVAAVQKVIQMLTDMSVKSKEKKKEDEVAFAKFSTWCEMESKSLKKDIKKNGEDIELLGTSIEKLASEIKEAGKLIGDLEDKIAEHEAQKKEEEEIREKTLKEYEKEHQDLSESVDALDRAIQVLQEQSYDRTGAEKAFMQLPEKVRALSMAFLQATDPNYEAPEANAYEFQSGGIVEALKRLKDDFRSKLDECEKTEMNSKHAYSMMISDLTDSIENGNEQVEQTKASKDAKTELKAQNKKQLAATIEDKAENEKTLKSMTVECREKSMSYEEKQKLRTEEVEAIAKAVEILESDDVSGNAGKHLDLAQMKGSAVALVQMGDHQAAAKRESGFRGQIRDFLAKEGARLHSQHLSLLAEKLAADPFAKVKTLIMDMITRLNEEAQQDAEHEGFCDAEMTKSKNTRTKLSEEIDGLNAAIEEEKAIITERTESTATLSKEIEELVTAMKEATELRQAEKKKNEKTIKDTQAATKAVKAATAVLKEFYEKASTATAFVQISAPKWKLGSSIKMGTDEWKALANPAFEGTPDQDHEEGMQTFGETEKGAQDENEYGVLALLEVVQSDFANVEKDTQAAEVEGAKTYKDFMMQSKKNKSVKERKIELNSKDKAEAESKLQENIADLKSTQDELLAADRYYEKLVPQCIDQGQTFEERTKAREEEITSLKEALKILGGDEAAA